MQITPPTASTPWSVALRLLIAFILGLPLGPWPMAPDWVPWLAPVAALVIAMLLSIQLDPLVQRGSIASERAVQVSLLSLLLVGAVVVAIAILLALGTGFIGLALIPLGISLGASFTVGSSGMWWLALGCGLVAWLGAAVHLLVGIAVISTLPGNTFGDIVFVLTIAEVIVGMVIAIPGALLGRMLRIGLLRQ